MAFQLGAGLLEACVLGVLADEDTYGYKLTQEVRNVMSVSESTLYPVLRRLMKEGYLAFLGARTEEVIRSYYVDKVIFSCKALNEDMGIMESKEAFGTTKKAMINSGKMRILVVDSTKFDQTAFSVAGQLRDIETIITDKKPSEKWLDHFNRHKIECIYPK